jgi:ferredoxin-NADP reductase
VRYEMSWSQATLRATQQVADNVRLFEIEPSGGASSYAPGSHLNLRVLIGSAQAERSYSLVGARPVDGAYRVAVQQREDSRGGSRYLWALEPGARLSVSTPSNLFELRLDRPEYLLVAGGIGITPMVGMAQTLARRGASFRLLYCGRDRALMPFVDELREELGDRLELFVSSEGHRIDFDREIAALHPDGELYLCGPQRMLEGARRVWQDADRPRNGLRFETFGSSGRFAAEPFEVTVADRDTSVTVGTTETLLEALEAAGIPSMYDCRRGECGLCQVKVLDVEGELDHRDVFFSDEEKESRAWICTCVSRIAGGRVTIDTGYRA